VFRGAGTAYPSEAPELVLVLV